METIQNDAENPPEPPPPPDKPDQHRHSQYFFAIHPSPFTPKSPSPSTAPIPIKCPQTEAPITTHSHIFQIKSPNQPPSFREVCSPQLSLPSHQDQPKLTFSPADPYNISLTEPPPDIPFVPIDESLAEKLCEPWKLSLIGKVVGKSLSFPFLRESLTKTLKEIGEWDLMSLGNGFFILNFKYERDLVKVYSGGPWLVSGYPLYLKLWEPGFKASEARVDSMAVWVTLPELPVELYDREIIEKIGQTLGKLIRVDIRTEAKERLKYARIFVQMEILKQIPEFIQVGKIKQRLEHQDTSVFCKYCKILGHSTAKCLKLESKKSSEQGLVEEGEWIDPRRRRRKLQSRGRSRSRKIWKKKSVQISNSLSPSDQVKGQHGNFPRANRDHSSVLDHTSKYPSSSLPPVTTSNPFQVLEEPHIDPTPTNPITTVKQQSLHLTSHLTSETPHTNDQKQPNNPSTRPTHYNVIPQLLPSIPNPEPPINPINPKDPSLDADGVPNHHPITSSVKPVTTISPENYPPQGFGGEHNLTAPIGDQQFEHQQGRLSNRCAQPLYHHHPPGGDSKADVSPPIEGSPKMGKSQDAQEERGPHSSPRSFICRLGSPAKSSPNLPSMVHGQAERDELPKNSMGRADPHNRPSSTSNTRGGVEDTENSSTGDSQQKLGIPSSSASELLGGKVHQSEHLMDSRRSDRRRKCNKTVPGAEQLSYLWSEGGQEKNLRSRSCSRGPKSASNHA